MSRQVKTRDILTFLKHPEEAHVGSGHLSITKSTSCSFVFIHDYEIDNLSGHHSKSQGHKTCPKSQFKNSLQMDARGWQFKKMVTSLCCWQYKLDVSNNSSYHVVMDVLFKNGNALIRETIID